MIIKLFNTSDSNNTINKTLTNETEFNIKFKGQADIINPVVKLQSETPILFNYGYIPDFKRYYFINNIVIEPNEIYRLELNVDVLESFKTDILTCYGYIKQSNNINEYYNAGYETEERKETEIFKGDVTIGDTENPTLIVTTIGGVV